MTDHLPIQPATPAEQARLQELVEQVKATPAVRDQLLHYWANWKGGQIIAPGSVEDRMERAFYEGFDLGIQQALGAVWMMERLMEAQEGEQQ